MLLLGLSNYADNNKFFEIRTNMELKKDLVFKRI